MTGTQNPSDGDEKEITMLASISEWRKRYKAQKRRKYRNVFNCTG